MSALSDNTISFVLTKSGLRAVRAGHPWLFSTGVSKQNKEGKSGDIAILYDDKRKFAGAGLYDANSPIIVRVLYSGKQISLSKEWLKDRISSCISKRKELEDDPHTTGYRLINGENDKLPGLVLDRYEETLVIKLDSACWLTHLDTIAEILYQLTSFDSIVLRLSRSVQDHSDIPDGETVYGEPVEDEVVFSENGILFHSDPVKGQKTGFFLDQRENRAKTGKLSKNEDVLNVFSYTGGFSLYAAKAGARSVTSLDISKPAMEACVANFELNSFETPHSLICGDAFEEMEKLAGEGKKYGVVIVDPPSFARKQSDTPQAIKAYSKLNITAVKLVKRGGILVSASCSARVSADDFFETVLKAVKSSGRRHQIIEKTFHASDHQAGFPEGAYLKCIYIRVD